MPFISYQGAKSILLNHQNAYVLGAFLVLDIIDSLLVCPFKISLHNQTILVQAL